MTTRSIVPAGPDAAVRDALQAMVRAHETGRYEPLQAAYMHAKNTLGELAASPASGKVSEAEVEKAAKAIWDCTNQEGTDPEWNELSDLNKEQGRILARAVLASLGLEVE